MKRWIVTMAGAGYLPASGTFASLLTCLLLWPILTYTPSVIATQIAIPLIGTLIFSILNIALAPWAINHFADKDPGQFVLDEAAGICLTLLLLPPRTGWSTAINLLAAFIAFRIFDITKPPPVRQLEKLPSGWGILTDDLAAAIYANLICQLFFRVVLRSA